MSVIISFSAIFMSILLVQLGNGALGPLDALSGTFFGFSTTQIGFLGSAHFAGLLLGCFINPWLIRRAGHARCFAVMAAASTISAILHPVFTDVYFWAFLRLLTGFALSGAYTVAESWLHAKLNKDNRGKVFSIYRVVDMSGTILAQGVVAALDPSSYIAYNVVAALCCLSLIPLALTRSVPPELPEARRLRPFLIFSISPLAAFGIITAGMTTAAFRMVGPVYALEIGLDTAKVAFFLVVGVLGGALAQIPAGIIADRYNRRAVLIGFSIAAVMVCGTIAFASSFNMAGQNIGYLLIFLFGAATLPIYSICATHANDFADKKDIVDLSASLILVYALGAMVSPAFSGFLIQQYGAASMFIYITIMHISVVAYSLWRMTIRPATSITSYRYVPKTTLFISSFLRNQRGKDER